MENRPIRPRSNHEEQMIRKRERETQHAETWGNTVKYYDKIETDNAKYSDWTSPQYYKEQGEMIEEMDAKKQAEKNLDERKNRLHKLVQEEEATYDVELIRVKAAELKNKMRGGCKLDEVPDEVLKSVNDTLKLDDETKRRYKAEEALYKQWKGNNPVLRDYEARENMKSVKMSWLDQQIEKRMALEKEEEEMKLLAKERDRYIKEQKEKEEALAREMELKRKELDDALKEQIELIKTRDAEAKELKQAEDEAFRKKCEAADLRELWEKEEKQREEKEVVLFNMRTHKRKLEEKSKHVKEELKKEQEFLERIKQADMLDRIEDENKKHELRQSMDDFNLLIIELHELEKKRKPFVDFTFDSEAKSVYEQFDETWRKEKEMRQGLMREVLSEIEKHIAENVEKTKRLQLKIIEEKEELIEKARKYKEEMDGLKVVEEKKREEYKKELDEQIKENKMRKRRIQNSEKNKYNEEIENLRLEEERVRKEISKLRANGNIYQDFGKKKTFLK